MIILIPENNASASSLKLYGCPPGFMSLSMADLIFPPVVKTPGSMPSSTCAKLLFHISLGESVSE